MSKPSITSNNGGGSSGGGHNGSGHTRKKGNGHNAAGDGLFAADTRIGKKYKARKIRRGRWKKGESGNPAGTPPTERMILSQHRVRIMARTGMMPLDFMTAVYRNELYEDYVQRVAEDGRTIYYEPAAGAKRIVVDSVALRLNAAAYAAPYIHKRMPQGIELSARESVGITAERLRKLSSTQLNELMRLMDTLGLDVDVAMRAGKVIEGEGRLLRAPEQNEGAAAATAETEG